MAKKEKLSLEELLEQALVKGEDTPYKVSDNWVWTRLESIAEVVTGGTPTKAKVEYYGGKFPFVKPADLNQGRYVRYASEYLSELGRSVSRIVPASSTSICCIGTIGKTGYLECEATTNQQINTIIPKINGLYIYYYCLSDGFQSSIIELASATTISIVNKGKMLTIAIPLPPLPEQQRIVTLIESLFEKLDRAKELAQNALDSFENRKSAILHKAFTGELTGKWREENGVDFDKDWVEKTMGNCGKWFGGGTPSKSNPQFWKNGNILWVTPKDMKLVCIEDTEDKITEIAVDNSSVKIIPNAAVLFVVRSGILRRILPIAITTGPVTVNQDMKAIIPRDIDIKYFYWYCLGKESDIRNKCAKNGTTVESISSDLLYVYKILVPPLKEQQEIVRILDSLLENEQQAKELCNVIDKIDHIKKSILAKAFRGELSTNHPEEESALELLKEVLTEKT